MFFLHTLQSSMKTKLKAEPPFISIRKSLTTVFTNNNWPTAQYNKGVYQAQVVQKVDSAIHWINHYPVDHNTYPLDSDLSGG